MGQEQVEKPLSGHFKEQDLGALGKVTRTRGLDTGGLTDVLNNSNAQAQAQAPTGLGSILGGLLDQDKDGSVMDDLARIGGGLFGKK